MGMGSHAVVGGCWVVLWVLVISSEDVDKIDTLYLGHSYSCTHIHVLMDLMD